MTKFKRKLASVIAAVAMAFTSVSAFADSWEINYIQGAPTSISNYSVMREYRGLNSDNFIYVHANVTTGSVALDATGFNPEANTLYFYAPVDDGVNLINPNPNGCSIKIYANENRVVANGFINVI